MTTTTCGHVSVERTKDKATAQEAGKDGFGYDKYRREFVRITISGPASVVDVVKTEGVDMNYGFPWAEADPPGVCRVWLPYWISDPQTLVNLREIMKEGGFEPAVEIDASEMELLTAVNLQARFGLGHGLKNWTKKMTEAEWHGMLEHCTLCSGYASSFLCGECVEELAAPPVPPVQPPHSKCEADPERMFDCDCGTCDSYCVKCEAYMPCQQCSSA